MWVGVYFTCRKVWCWFYSVEDQLVVEPLLSEMYSVSGMAFAGAKESTGEDGGAGHH